MYSIVGYAGQLPELVQVAVLFCATTLSTITLIASGLYLLLRPLPSEGILAPFMHFVQRFRELSFVFVVMIATYVAIVLLKDVIAIPRPYVLDPSLVPLFEMNDLSFPSGHAAIFAALATSFWFVQKKAGVILGVAAICIALARVLAGVHTLVDIGVGFVVGICIASIIHYISEVVHT